MVYPSQHGHVEGAEKVRDSFCQGIRGDPLSLFNEFE